MITVEEAQNPENAEKAAVIFKWIDDRGPGMRGGEVTSSRQQPNTDNTAVTDAAALVSPNKDNDNNRDTFIVEEKPKRATLTQENISDSDFNNDNEVPTERRRQKNIKDQGQRATTTRL